MLLRDLNRAALFGPEDELHVVFCPRCKSTDVKDSLYRVSDLAALLVGFKPYRCKSCQNRFRVWRLLREQIHRPDPAAENALVPVSKISTDEAPRRNRRRPLTPPAPPIPATGGFALAASGPADVSHSLFNLFAATSGAIAGAAGTPDFDPVARPVARKRIVEAEFTASLFSAAVATGPSTRSPAPRQQESAYERHGLGVRPRMHMSQRPAWYPEAKAGSEATADMYPPIRR